MMGANILKSMLLNVSSYLLKKKHERYHKNEI